MNKQTSAHQMILSLTWRLKVSLLMITSLSIFTLGACDDDTTASPTRCGYNTDCPVPEQCIEGVCRLECRVSTDCESGARCFEGVCYVRPTLCRADEECAPFQEVCDLQSGICVPPNTVTPPVGSNAGTMAGTPAGMTTGGSSMAGAPGGSLGGDTAGMSAGTGGGSIAGTSGGSLAGTMSGGGAAGEMSAGSTAGAMSGGQMMSGVEGGETPVTGRGQYGDDCNCPSDCESGYCVVNKMKRSRTCASGCEVDSECPGIDTCLQAQVSPASGLCPDVPSQLPPPGTIVGVCAPNETSFPCTDPSGCTSGICLTPPQVVPWTSPQAVCTMACEDDLKCPTGYRCGAAGGIAGTICVPEAQVSACPTGMANTCGGVCNAPPGREEIDIAVCLNGFNQTAGYCTCTCSVAADCPSGFGCSRIGDTGDPTRPGVCIPFAGETCPESDRGVEQCLSTTCLVDEDDITLNICTSFCLRADDCPADYDCVSVGDASVCIPRDR